MDNMQQAKSRLRKHSSSLDSRSRSSSFNSPRRNNRSRFRRPSSPSPQSRRGKYSENKLSSVVNSESRNFRLYKPEIQSSVHPVSDFYSESRLRERVSSPISLSDRFDRLTVTGTSLFNRRRYGRSGDSDRLPHLILTNNTKLPPATLMRQAKEITIVIERTFPSGMSKLSQNAYDFGQGRLIIPRRPTEGYKPVFDRPEIRIYNTEAEEELIVKRLNDYITASYKSRRLKRRDGFGDRDSAHDYHDIAQFAGPGRFYGSRVDERVVDSKNTFSLDPMETPKGQSYYLHDDRAEDNYDQRRRWHSNRGSKKYSSRDYNLRNRRDYRRSSNTPPHSHGLDVSTKPWVHDKFEEIEGVNTNQNSESDNRVVPRPVPAPKPILWSTIGKEINNDVSKTSQSRNNKYSPNSALNQSPLPNDHQLTSGNRQEAGVLLKDGLFDNEVDVTELVFDESMEQ